MINSVNTMTSINTDKETIVQSETIVFPQLNVQLNQYYNNYIRSFYSITNSQKY